MEYLTHPISKLYCKLFLGFVYSVIFLCLRAGDGYLKTFLEKTAGMSPMERAIFLGEFEVHYIVCMS